MNSENELLGVVVRVFFLEGFWKEIDIFLLGVMEARFRFEVGGEMREFF